MVLDDLDGWRDAMSAELDHPRFHGAWVRIHDSGDFFSTPYLMAWLEVIRAHPNTNFYAYTKEVTRLKAHLAVDPPDNFAWVYSYGGREDAAIDPEHDRVADVFPDEATLTTAGYSSQAASDLLAVLGPRLVGVPANRIPHFIKRLAGRSLREWQAELDTERARRKGSSSNDAAGRDDRVRDRSVNASGSPSRARLREAAIRSHGGASRA
jgi:hypothetical protein